MSDDQVICTSCKKPTDALAVFPGGICLECYKKTPDATRPITAEELTAMWGGPVERRGLVHAVRGYWRPIVEDS